MVVTALLCAALAGGWFWSAGACSRKMKKISGIHRCISTTPGTGGRFLQPSRLGGLPKRPAPPKNESKNGQLAIFARSNRNDPKKILSAKNP